MKSIIKEESEETKYYLVKLNSKSYIKLKERKNAILVIPTQLRNLSETESLLLEAEINYRILLDLGAKETSSIITSLNRKLIDLYKYSSHHSNLILYPKMRGYSVSDLMYVHHETQIPIIASHRSLRHNYKTLNPSDLCLLVDSTWTRERPLELYDDKSEYTKIQMIKNSIELVK